ncbi:MAG TPA: hypothetical protein VMX97_09295 [Hyphomicrobiaceae bacterium]|nr:hypothetical protein [Hyphomicrobiaceae bacterium]
MFDWLKRRIGASQKGALPPEVAAMLDRASALLENDDMQNSLLPEEVRQAIVGGTSCDTVPGARGEFGHTSDNPIPVNGPLGEVLYLSHLRTAKGVPLLFHRMGSAAALLGGLDIYVDIYEVLPMEKGARSELLFFSMYHPRKSHLAPNGYLIDRSRDPGNEIYGVSWLVEDFPNALDAHIRKWQMESLGIPLSINKVRTYLNGSPFAPSPPLPR